MVSEYHESKPRSPRRPPQWKRQATAPTTSTSTTCQQQQQQQQPPHMGTPPLQPRSGGAVAYQLRGGHVTPPLSYDTVLPSSGSHHRSCDDRHAWPKGLQNVGNTCYANAALQCLLSTALSQALLCPRASAIFRRYSSNPNLLEAGEGAVTTDDPDDMGNDAGNYDDQDNSPELTQRERYRKEKEERRLLENCQWLTEELKSITLEYTKPWEPSSPATIAEWLGVTAPGPVVDPGSITSKPDRLSKCLRPYQQEDAHEFLRALLGTLVMNGQNRELSSLFDGLLESAVICETCRRPSLTRDRYMDLSLDIVNRHVTCLRDALDDFTKSETLTGDNMVYCQRCKSKQPASKGLRLATAPSILVCHLKRFALDPYGNLIRLDKRVDFPLRLEIGDFMSRVNKARPPPYDLVAVLVHQGVTCDSGHYLAYVKNGGSWFKCNDSQVEKVDVATVRKQQAYILMYEVAEMRDNHGYPSPNKLHLPPRPEKKDRGMRGSFDGEKPLFSWTDMLCSIDTSLVSDACCGSTPMFKTPKSSNGSDSGSVRGRRRRRRRTQPRDDSTIESTGESDSGLPMRRSKSSGSMRKRQPRRNSSSSRPMERPTQLEGRNIRLHSFNGSSGEKGSSGAALPPYQMAVAAAAAMAKAAGGALETVDSSAGDPEYQVKAWKAGARSSSQPQTRPRRPRELPPRPSSIHNHRRVFSSDGISYME